MRDIFLADQAGIAARHAAVLRPNITTRLMVTGGIAAAIALYLAGLVLLGFSPARILAGLYRLGDIIPLMMPPIPASWARTEIYLDALGQTLAIAFLGTMAAAILAIMSSDLFSYAKLMSEAIETADRRPVEGVLASGGSRLQSIRFGIVPQVLPVLASQVLYYFESNTRSATIIGIVGAGGIGLVLSEQIRVLEWNEAAAIILMVLVTVAIIDAISERLRAMIIGRK